MTTQPRRSLPPQSEPWGSDVDARLGRLESKADMLSGYSGNDARTSNASLDGLSSQIQELYRRQAMLVQVPDVVTSYFGPIETSPVASVNFALPRPDSRARMGWISVQGRFELDGEQADSVGFVTYLLDGRKFGQTSEMMPLSFTGLDDWGGSSFIGYTGFVVSPDVGGTLTVRVQGRGYAAPGIRRMRLTDIQATIQYGQPV